MSFVSRPSFSSASASGVPMQRALRASAASLFGGAGRGVSLRAASAGIQGLAGALRPQVTPGDALAAVPADGKETMRCLNDRLADYLSKVRLLEESNDALEQQIKESQRGRGGGLDRDWSGYEKTMADLREQIWDMTTENARLLLQIDNARLAADDFNNKFESELNMRQGVEQDIAGLRKLIDDTQMSRMQLENQIESLKEELEFLKNSHEQDMANLQDQRSESNISVAVDTPNAPDLSETIDQIRRQYEKAAQKNLADTDAWYKSKFDNISKEVSDNTEALQSGQSELNDLRRQIQTLEIDLQALHKMNRSLEDTLAETEHRYANEVSHHNNIILQLEAELGQVRAQVERQAAEYQDLLNMKMKLEAEISTYHQLLEGLGDNVGGDSSTAATRAS
ncbi:keratin, type I cytoskeletal 18 isoform X3 [Denticeps clupeoides]|uniref:keratin, type I cytoskeletal 18 isoform X3 n=1 Tax=Denticeps clupeoides TaxID=299321 RepID=UPI0010A52213|nr:keratin, type I cytoskeletal 18-like isoform X3 [Denticeps clupeoides]